MKKNIQQIGSIKVIQFLFKLYKVSPIGVLGMVISQLSFAILTTTIAPIFISKLMTQIARGDATLNNSVGLLIGYIIALFFGDIVAVRITLALAYIVESKMQALTLEKIMENQTAKSFNFHSNHMSGGIVSDTNKLIGSIERFWDSLMFTATPIIGAVLSVTIALSFIYWQYAIVLFVLALIITILIIRFQTSIAPISKKVSIRSSAQTAYFADVISNIATVKAFSNEKYELKSYKNKIDDWKTATLKEMRSVLVITGGFGLMLTIMNISAFLAAILATQYKIANIGTIYLVINYTLSVVIQLWTISSITRSYIRIIGDASPMITMLNEPIDLLDPKNPQKVQINRGGIKLENIVFGHEQNKLLFNKLNLVIKPGEKIGLIGHSGSGKTTLTRLLLRFIDIKSGRILIDNQDITSITQHDLRSKIAYVPQEPVLFHRSIRENITYGELDANLDTIQAIAKMASAHDFITALPKGYDTLVGERGVKLSGGQRQRIAIARAMLKNVPILILDEATSSLDSESENLIQKALWKLMENKTAIVVAHRLSTIQRMDRIIVMENGQIIEEGSHKELIHKNGVYTKLWSHQSGDFLKD